MTIGHYCDGGENRMERTGDKSKTASKKTLKRNRMFEAAYNLFSTRGVNNTAIDDIVKEAGVAKGTFYLYFKDKYDIIDRLILSKSSEVLREAMEATIKHEHCSFIEGTIFLIDYLIEYFKNNRMLLKMIYKNLSWGLYRKALARPDEYKEMQEIRNILLDNLKIDGFSESEIEKILFLVIELTGSVIYSSIILGEPDSIDHMKPILFRTIKKMLTQ